MVFMLSLMQFLSRLVEPHRADIRATSLLQMASTDWPYRLVNNIHVLEMSLLKEQLLYVCLIRFYPPKNIPKKLGGLQILGSSYDRNVPESYIPPFKTIVTSLASGAALLWGKKENTLRRDNYKQRPLFVSQSGTQACIYISQRMRMIRGTKEK